MKKAALSIFIFSFLFLISHFSPLISPSFAQTETPQANPSAGSGQANYPAPSTNSDVPNNLHNWTQTVMIEVMSSLTCQIAGVDPINPKQSCLGADQTTGKIGFLSNPPAGGGGAIGFMGTMITALYTPPLHTADYFQNLAQNFGITKKTYAQNAGLPAEASAKAGGTGFQSLSPLINIWSAFRNIVYLILVIIFVIIGLAIMLRVKIDPRTVMTIQNQIPKIIIGILAVTFSFAIAGFLIDIMWVLIFLIYNVISGIPNTDVNSLNPVNMAGQNPFGALGVGNILSIIFNSAVGIGGILGSLLGAGSGGGAGGAGIGAALGTFGFFFGPLGFLTTAIGGMLGLIGIGNIVGGTAGVIGGIIAFLIIGIALFTALFRLWFTLLMAYVQILLAVVLAPFWIIGGIIPGSPISLGGWFKNIAANLLAFPVVIVMFMLGKVFMNIFGKAPATGTPNFVPPLIGNPGNPSLIGSLIALGIILMTPNVVNMLKAALKAPKMDTGGIGAALRVGVGAPMGAAKSAGGMYTAARYNPLTGVAFSAGTEAERDQGRRGMLGRLVGRVLK